MRKAITVEEFKERANKIFNNFYKYNKVNELHRLKDIVTVTCPIHGDFPIQAYHHLEGMGCKECSFDIQRNKHWKEDAIKVHGTKYDYSSFIYKNNKTVSDIICPIHGVFHKSMNAHIHGKQGCPECSKEEQARKTSLELEEFIVKSKAIYGDDAFDYSEVNYKNNKTLVILTCKKCGYRFECRPDNHLNGHGCSHCHRPISKWEQEIVDFLNSLNIELEQSNRTILKGKELDLYLPQYKIGIECDGLYWHNDLFKDKDYHLNKLIDCYKQGIRLIHIFEDEWYHKQEIVKSILINILHKTKKRIYARKCKIKEIDIQTAKEFLNINDLEGYEKCSYRYGLYFNNELVSVMTFSKIKNCFKLVRYTNKCNYSVVGGASKLFKYFIKNVKFQNIVSQCDKRIFCSNLYDILGFKLKDILKPDYFYVSNRKRLSKNKVKKNDGLNRIYNCGYDIYEYLAINKKE